MGSRQGKYFQTDNGKESPREISNDNTRLRKKVFLFCHKYLSR
jgi:hypothetical protein